MHAFICSVRSCVSAALTLAMTAWRGVESESGWVGSTPRCARVFTVSLQLRKAQSQASGLYKARLEEPCQACYDCVNHRDNGEGRQQA